MRCQVALSATSHRNEMAAVVGATLVRWLLAEGLLDERLDPGEVRRQLAGIEALPPEVDQAMRSSGHYGPRVVVADGADEQTRLLAFMGRGV